MGVSLYCKKTGTCCDMSYIGFYHLRNKIAYLCCNELGSIVDELNKAITRIFDSEDEKADFYRDIDHKIESLILAKKVSVKVVDFIMQSDCKGKIRYGACKEIYKHIKDYDDNICYGYAGHLDCAMFKDFKSLLKECYDNKSDLVWS